MLNQWLCPPLSVHRLVAVFYVIDDVIPASRSEYERKEKGVEGSGT